MPLQTKARGMGLEGKAGGLLSPFASHSVLAGLGLDFRSLAKPHAKEKNHEHHPQKFLQQMRLLARVCEKVTGCQLLAWQWR